MSTYLSGSVETQCELQLHAMVHALENLQSPVSVPPYSSQIAARQLISEQEKRKQNNFSSRLSIQLRGQSLIVQAAASTRQARTRSLVLTPLFAGSYTQPDVAVQRIDSALGVSGGLSALSNVDPSPCLFPTVPDVHFAQFSRLSTSLRIESKVSRKRIVMLASDIFELAVAEGQRLTPVDLLKQSISQHTDCHIIVVDIHDFLQTSSRSSAWQQKRRHNQLRQSLSCLGVNARIIPLPRDELTTLITLFHQADMVYAHSAGLTIDAMNSGCRVIIGNHPVSLQGSGVEDFKAARHDLAIEQMAHLQAQEVIHSLRELYSLVQDWLQPEGWLTDTGQVLTNPIIPLDTFQTRRIRSSLASGKAKLRKLYQSPEQFFQDSRYPILHRLGKRRLLE